MLCLLQGIFPTQKLNRGLLPCRQILYQLSYQGSPSVCLVSGRIVDEAELHPGNDHLQGSGARTPQRKQKEQSPLSIHTFSFLSPPLPLPSLSEHFQGVFPRSFTHELGALLARRGGERSIQGRDCIFGELLVCSLPCHRHTLWTTGPKPR